jgi:hypothetical protein
MAVYCGLTNCYRRAIRMQVHLLRCALSCPGDSRGQNRHLEAGVQLAKSANRPTRSDGQSGLVSSLDCRCVVRLGESMRFGTFSDYTMTLRLTPSHSYREEPGLSQRLLEDVYRTVYITSPEKCEVV